ncbi:ejaculatory bulb-specific protein 3-like [Schistocerca americana]|uniref:ejaculatory bulb-specific protein 3-like n=1 Tax=Schistocerca americana TaxID=7009 RepID=UPI001F4F9BD0|nr:ejaculatory bulb-specific protein 3-like [Schistocerca americana]
MHGTRYVALPAQLVLSEDAAPYSSKYDSVDLDKVLASERLLNSYFQCLMADTEEGCTAHAKYLKMKVIPDALSNGCSRCHPNQREGAEKVIRFLMKDKPFMWNKLEVKYDPEGVYRKKYQKEYDTAKGEENIEPCHPRRSMEWMQSLSPEAATGRREGDQVPNEEQTGLVEPTGGQVRPGGRVQHKVREGVPDGEGGAERQ